MMTLNAAIYIARNNKSRNLGRALNQLAGCPVGAWGQTEQARRAIVNELPLRAQRDYTVDQLIDSLFTVNKAERYELS